MGFSSLLGCLANPDGAGSICLNGLDTSMLSGISPPNLEIQKKCEAMGLPDPVAFAALTALGAIPNPMAMLNAMMLSAHERIEGKISSDRSLVMVADLGAITNLRTHALGGGLMELPDAQHEQQGSHEGQKSNIISSEFKPVQDGSTDHIAQTVRAPGKSFIEAFQELQRAHASQQEIKQLENRRPSGPISGYVAAAQRAWGQQVESETDAARREKRKHAKEAAAQAKMAAERAKEAALTAKATADAIQGAPTSEAAAAVAAKGIAQVFSSAAEDDLVERTQPPPSRTAPPLQTLSSLLSGGQSYQDGAGALAMSSPALDKLCISRLPVDVTDSAVRLECARHGAVTSVILEADGSAAYITFAGVEMAASAMRRISGKIGILGSLEPLDVKLVSEVPDSVRLAAELPPEHIVQVVDPADLPDYLKPRTERKRRHSRSRRRSRSQRSRHRQPSKSRRRRRQSRSVVRWLDRSRSNSHTATGQYIRATGCSSTVRWWEKKRSSSSSSSSSKSRRRRPHDEFINSRRPRQVAIKGNWAQFVLSGASYYYNLLTGQAIWDKPSDFDAGLSRRSSGANTSMLL